MPEPDHIRLTRKNALKRVSTFLLLSELLMAACVPSAEQVATQVAAAATMTATTWTQTPTPKPSQTPTPTPTHSPTATASATTSPSPMVVSLGATRDAIQAAYEQLGVEFNPPESVTGQPVVVGGYVNSEIGNEILVFVRIVGRPNAIQEASVTVYIPYYLAITPNVAARQHEKTIFALRQLLDTVLPEWTDGPDWLDTSFRGFGSVNETRQVAQTQIGHHVVILDAEVGKLDQVDTISTALTIKVEK